MQSSKAFAGSFSAAFTAAALVESGAFLNGVQYFEPVRVRPPLCAATLRLQPDIRAAAASKAPAPTIAKVGFITRSSGRQPPRRPMTAALQTRERPDGCTSRRSQTRGNREPNPALGVPIDRGAGAREGLPMRIRWKTCIAALVSAALVGAVGVPALAGPHGGGPAGFGGAPRGGSPGFAGARGGPSFGGHAAAFGASRGFSGRSMSFGAPRGFSHTMSFARGGSSGFRAQRGFSPRTVTARNFGRNAHALATTAGARSAWRNGRAALASNGFRGRGPLASGFTGRGAFANPAFNGRNSFAFDSRFRGGFDRFHRFDRGDSDFDDLFWPIGLGLAFDWAVGYPACPYWDYWDGWCDWDYPAVYWGYGYPDDYGWGPAYAWNAVWVPDYGYDYGYEYADWAPAPYYAPPVGYAVWTPDYGYAGYDDGCATQHYVWDPELGGYVARRDYYDCWA